MDKRIKRTRRLLGEAFIELLQTQEFQTITIRDITDKADVAYSTFFRNFESKEDLLLIYLRDFLTQLEHDIQIQAEDSLRTQTLHSIGVLLRHLQQSPKMCFVLLKTPAVQPILKAFQAELIQANIHAFRKMNMTKRADSPPVELIFHNGMIELFGLIEWWLDNNFQPDIQKMLGYYEQLIMHPKWTLLVGQQAMMELLDLPPD